MTGIIFEAVPNSGTVKVRTSAKGVSVVWPNKAVFTDKVKAELAQKANSFVHSGDPRHGINLNTAWVVNSLADSDEYSHALANLAQATKADVPVFNHPNAVAATRRDISAKIMLGIPNLIVPKCVRFVPEKLNDFRDVMRENSLRYPLLVRPARSQSGTGLMKVKSDTELLSYMAANALRIPYYLTQYVDFQRASGRKPFTKLRLAFVGGKVFLRGFAEQSYWNINRAFGNQTTNREVQKFLVIEKNFDKLKTLKDMGENIASRGGLDFWGVDLGYLGNGKYVLFEANAAMSILMPQGLTTAQQHMVQPLIDRIESALLKQLHDRDSWVNPFGEKTPVKLTLNAA